MEMGHSQKFIFCERVMRIQVGNVLSKVTECTAAESDLLAKILCVPVPGHKFMPRFKSGQWDGQKRFYAQATKTFPTGFLPFIITEAHAKKFVVETDDQRKVLGLQDPTRIAEMYPRLRDYQLQGIVQALTTTLKTDNAVLPWARGILKYPTNTGKTFMAVCLTDFLHKKTLYLVERQELLFQTHKEFQKHTKMSVGLLGAGEQQFDADITFAMAQTVRSILKGEKQDRKVLLEDFLKTIDCLVLDECHHMSDGVYDSVSRKCPAPFRFALSATPLKRGDLGDVYLIANMGEVIAEGERGTLEKQGHIGRVVVYMFDITQPQLGKMNFADAYQAGIVENDYRNEDIVTATEKLLEKGCTILILVRHRHHGLTIQGMLTKVGVESRCISGIDKTTTRQDALKGLGKDFRVLIATRILNEGVDITALDAVIRAGGWKKDLLSVQESGRGRNKTLVRIVDFFDRTHKDLLAHSAMRKASYDAAGFKVVFPEHV